MRREWEEDFAAWARSRQGALLRAAVLLTGDEASAQDLVQEALIKVADRWGRLRDDNPEAYARRILYRDAVSAWRRQRRVVVAGEVPEGATPGRVEAWVAGADVREALLTLTPKQRAVLVFRYYEDLAEVEIARVLGVSPGTVKSQAHIGLRRLREAMAASAATSASRGGGPDE